MIRFCPRLAFRTWGIGLLLVLLHPVLAQSNIDPAAGNAWASSSGLINWRPNPTDGAVIGEFFCSGHVYSPALGWITLGSGQPVNGFRYGNDSSSDFGVNHDGQGNLRGFAYGANIGWIAFEELGAPRVDLRSGALHGSVYSANTGWIFLDGPLAQLRVLSIAAGPDQDDDDLPDAWEYHVSGGTDLLSGIADTDEDGQSDHEEYLADSDPTDREDYLQILSLTPDVSGVVLSWTARPTRRYWIETRPDLEAEAQLLPVAGTLAGSGVLAQQVETAAGGRSFYRIRAERPLQP